MGLLDRLFVRRKEPAAFWRWFAAEAGRLHATDFGADPRAVEEIGRHLDAAVDGLTFQISGARADGRRDLEISADGMRDRIEAVRGLVSIAPTMYGWRVVAFRQPVEESAAIEFAGRRLDWDSVRYVAHPHARGVDLRLFVDGLTEENAGATMGAVFLLLDAVVGEETVMTRIDEITPHPLALAPQGHRALIDLRDELGVRSPA